MFDFFPVTTVYLRCNVEFRTAQIKANNRRQQTRIRSEFAILKFILHYKLLIFYFVVWTASSNYCVEM